MYRMKENKILCVRTVYVWQSMKIQWMSLRLKKLPRNKKDFGRNVLFPPNIQYISLKQRGCLFFCKNQIS